MLNYKCYNIETAVRLIGLPKITFAATHDVFNVSTARVLGEIKKILYSIVI